MRRRAALACGSDSHRVASEWGCRKASFGSHEFQQQACAWNGTPTHTSSPLDLALEKERVADCPQQCPTLSYQVVISESSAFAAPSAMSCFFRCLWRVCKRQQITSYVPNTWFSEAASRWTLRLHSALVTNGNLLDLSSLYLFPFWIPGSPLNCKDEFHE